LAANPENLAARELMFDAQFQRRSCNKALAELELLRKAKPESLLYRAFPQKRRVNHTGAGPISAFFHPGYC
jgi:hypothetical protein